MVSNDIETAYKVILCYSGMIGSSFAFIWGKIPPERQYNWLGICNDDNVSIRIGLLTCYKFLKPL